MHPNAKSSRQSRSISAWAAPKKGLPNPSATDPLTTASGRSRRFTTDAMARPTSVPACAHDDGGGKSCGLPRDRRQRRPRRLRLKAATAAAPALPPAGLDDHVADVTGVAEAPPEEPSVEHDAAAHTGRHHHGDVVLAAGGRADPALTECEGLGVVVDEGRHSGQLGEPCV